MSEEVCSITGRRKSATECIETISEKLQTQKLVENVVKKIPIAIPAVDQDIYLETCSTISLESCDLKRLSDFNPKERPIVSPLKKSDNAVPHRWESPMLKALKVGSEADKENGDPFTQIPSRYSASPLASALAVAPSEPFNPHSGITLEPVPLPEETVPYFPPEHPVLPEPEEPKPTKGIDKFGKAKPPEAPAESKPIRRRKIGKDPTDEFFKDLPKPEKKLTMRDALTTASDRPYSPLIYESIVIVEERTNKEDEKNKIDKSKLQRPLKSATLPVSFKPPHSEEKPNPSTYPLYKELKIATSSEETCQEEMETKQTEVIIKQPVPVPFKSTQPEEKSDLSSTSLLIKSSASEQSSLEETEMKQTEIVQKQTTIQPAIQITQGERDETGCYPIFKGFSCSFENKSEHSQFKIEISTTPPLIEKHPTTELKQGEIKSETVTTEKTLSAKSKTSEKAEQKETVAKQSEEVVYKKPIPLSSALHKPDTLPQYQVNLSENAEAEIMLMEKKEAAQQRMEQKKLEQQEIQKSIITSSEPVKKPIITIQPGDAPPQSESSFIPVSEDRLTSGRPRPITPSMINKGAPVIPYYQQNLVPYQCPAPHSNMLDPASPNISRSPSPCPGGRKSPSPFLSATASATLRPQSPAAGPPPNPLRAPVPPPSPKDIKFDRAQKTVTNFIPQYKSKRDIYEKERALEIAEAGGTTQMYSSQVNTQNILPQMQGSDVIEVYNKTGESSIVTDAKNVEGCQMKSIEMKAKEVEDKQKAQLICKQTERGTESTAISEQSHAEHSEQLRKSETKSVQQSNGIQIQRKKTVTEEFEHTQKSKVIQIEKNVTTSQGFRNVSNVENQQAITGLHVTCPQKMQSPFLKTTQTQPSIKPASTKCDSCPKSCATCPKPCTNCPEKCNKTTNSEQRQACSETQAAQKPIQKPPPKPTKFVPGSSQKPPSTNKSNIPVPNAGSTGGRQAGAIGVAPKRGRGVLNTSAIGGTRVPLCASCHNQIRGPFITALGKIWCPDHFICATPSCRRPLQDLGFVEEQGQLYCEYCFEQYLAPSCSKCGAKIKGDCLKAIGKNFHPECFNCVYCGKLFGNNPFFLEDGNPYCEADWNELFTTKCFACGFPVEAGDRWVEALNNNYHSQCFNCTMCKKNLEGQSFFAKGGRPFCKNHAR